MPLKRSGSREALNMNIREMVKSGRKPSQAVAASLANQRKYMAQGGMVGDTGEDTDDLQDLQLGSVDSRGDMGEAGEPINPEGSDPEGLSIGATSDAAKMAEAMMAKHYGANSMSHEPMMADDPMAGQKMAEGGLVEDEANNVVGSKPSQDMDDMTEQPMSSMPMKPAMMGHSEPVNPGMPMPSGLSEEAKQAIARRKAARKYGNYDPR